MSEVAVKNSPEVPIEYVKLGDVTEVIRGASPRPKGNPKYFGGNIPWIMIADVTRAKGKFITSTRDTVTEEGAKKSRYLKKGTLILSNSGTVCVPKILGFDGCIHDGFVAFPEINSDFDKEFLYHYFNYIRPRIINENRQGITQVNLNTTIVKNIDVPVFELEQQKRIVAKIEELFSHIDAGIEALKKAKQLLNQYRQSVLKAAVTGELTKEWREANKDKLEPESDVHGSTNAAIAGREGAAQLLEHILKERRQKWEEQQLEQFKAKGKMLKDDVWKGKYKEPKPPTLLVDLRNPEEWELASVDQVAEVLLGKMLDKAKHTTGDRLPYLRNINVRWGNVETDDVLEMFFKDNELERYGLEVGDVLVCEGGEPGRAAVWEKANVPMKYQKALHRVRFYKKLVPQYLVYLLEYFASTGLIERYFTGSTIKHFTKESFTTMPFPLPSLLEMEQIVFEVDEKTRSIKRLEAELDLQLLKAEKSKQSILATAFSGRLQ